MSRLPRALPTLLVVAAVLLPLTAAVSVAPHLFSRGLIATYYSGSEWSGPPGLVIIGDEVGEDWLATHAARFGERPFSVTWQGWLLVERPAPYEFSTASDDGSMLYVDSSLVVDNRGKHRMQERRGSVTLTRGLHRIYVDYFQLQGDAQLQVRMAREGRPLEPVPPAILFPTRIAYYLQTTWQPGYLVATVWSCAMLLAVGAWAVSRVRRHTETQPADLDLNRWLWRLLALAVVLIVSQGAFGLPVWWENDELRAQDVVPGLEQAFSNGWYDHYPPIYFYLLALVSLPFKLGATVGVVDLWSAQTILTEALLYRATAMLCGLAVVYLAYRCGTEAFDSRRTGLWGGFLVAVIPNVVYLAKLAKPEMPYVAAFMVAMLVYVKILRHPSPSAYGVFALAGMTAICIKDQAYGFFVLPAMHLVWLRCRAHAGSVGVRVGLALRDPALQRAAGVSIATFVVAHNLLFNWEGFRLHVGLIVGGGSEGFRMYEPTLAGHSAMLRDGLGQVPWMLGWASTSMVVLGVVAAWRERRHATIALLLPIASYYLTFISVIQYQYDRFYLAPAALLAIFGGHALGTLWSSAASWRRAVAVAVAGYSLAYGASINLMMANDSRFAAEAWLADHVSETATVGAFGPQAYLPRAGAVRFQELEPDWNVVDIVSPEFLVLNAEHAQRARDAEFYRPLLDGTQPEYRPVARFKSPPGVAVLAYDRIFSNGREDQFTNLDKINPDIRVFARRDVSLPE